MQPTESAESTADNATVKRPRGRPFQKGEPRPAGAGRRRGATNKATKDIREFIQGITLGDKTFCDNLSAFCKSPQVFEKPHLMAVLFAYGFGKATPMEPKEELRSPLLFVMATGKPIGEYDPLQAKAAALLARKQAALLPPADTYVPADPNDPDALQIVETPPEPGTIAASMIRPSGR